MQSPPAIDFFAETAALGLHLLRRFCLSSGSHWMFAACSIIQYMLLYRIVDYAVKQ
jgi:hypothetical protein